MRLLPLLALVALLTGCAATTRVTFDVAIRNACSRPLTVGFVKVGQPFDLEWASPENFAMAPPSRQPSTWGHVIEEGKTANVRIEGEFERGAIPYLRIYAGAHTLSELLAISRGTGDRLDVSLKPGRDNAFVITDPGAKLSARLMRLEPKPRLDG